MTATTLRVDASYAALSAGNPVARQPRWALRKRPARFFEGFDGKTLFYDCFWHDDGQRVILVGPPWRNLEETFAAAFFTALPSRTPVEATAFHSLSVTVTAIPVPEGTTALSLDIAGEVIALNVQPSFTKMLAGRRLLFSINKDNALDWIGEWALWHARRHGTEAVILFDNGSTTYAPEAIESTLAAVPGLTHVAVPRWPHAFGPIDPGVLSNNYWSRFLQISSLSVVLRRFGERASGLLDCDVDELAGTRSGTSIYELARRSPGGLVAFSGQWVEATGGTRHRDFTQRLADPKRSRSRPRKWALDPSRDWVRRLSVHPYWHWIEGRDRRAKSMPDDALYWHYKGINTNWKEQRSAPPRGRELEQDTLLDAQWRDLGAS